MVPLIPLTFRNGSKIISKIIAAFKLKYFVFVKLITKLHIYFFYYSYGLVGVRTQDSSKDFKQPLVIAYFNVDYKKNAKGFFYYLFNIC